MPQQFNKNTPYRYERKFTATAAHRSEILPHIKMHPAFFRETYHARQVNNIYLDTPAFKFYHDNKIGISDRKKVRIRWYDDLFGNINSPKLEYKIKSGLLGTKWTFDIVPMAVNKGFSKKYLSDVLMNSDLPAEIIEDLKMLSPTLINSYQRTYFLSGDQKYRLTFDEQLNYYRADISQNNFSIKQEQRNDFILELKYDENEDRHADNISTLFPFRLDKSSKYVTGIDLTK